AEFDLGAAELAVPAGLLLVPAVRLGGGGERLAIRDARQLEVHLHAEAALQLGYRDLDVRLALTGQQQFLRLRIAVVVERGILFLQALQRGADLFFVGTAPRLARVRDHRRGA